MTENMGRKNKQKQLLTLESMQLNDFSLLQNENM